MKMKKLTTLLLVLTIMLAQFSWVSFSGVTYAAGSTQLPTTVATQYFGNQLKQSSGNETEEKSAIRQDALKFYNAMVEMYNGGTFEKGEDYDLVAKNIVTQQQLQAYATGSQSLLYSMAAARDAFQYDYPDAFWIDYSAISLRVTLSKDGVYHAYLGAGKRDDYLLPGFTKSNIADARRNYENKMTEVLNYVKEETAKVTQASVGSAEYNTEAEKHDIQIRISSNNK